MKKLKNMRVILPFILIIMIAAVLWRGLHLQRTLIPSPLINTPAPTFHLPTLQEPQKMTSEKDFLGHVTLVNVWATWCPSCIAEHDFLLQLAKDEHIDFYGINYKDDSNTAINWIKYHGNPYQIIAVDSTGEVAINWGVYGTPETFIVDKQGIIRYKQIGPITPEIWNKHLKAIVDQLNSENP